MIHRDISSDTISTFDRILCMVNLDHVRVEVGALFDLTRVEADAADRDDVEEADEHGAHAAETHNTS